MLYFFTNFFFIIFEKIDKTLILLKSKSLSQSQKLRAKADLKFLYGKNEIYVLLFVNIKIYQLIINNKQTLFQLTYKSILVIIIK